MLATSSGMSSLAPHNDDAHATTTAESAHDQATALYFSATWCGPCRTFGPIVERMATALGDRVGLVKLDVDAAPELAIRYGVRSVPTLVVLRRGEVAARHTGSISEGALRRLLDAAL